MVAIGFRFDDCWVLVLPDLQRWPTPNFSDRHLQKRIPWLRSYRRDTWKWPKIRLDRSPEELDQSSQRRVDLLKPSERLGASARADRYFCFTRVSISAFRFWYLLHQFRLLSLSYCKTRNQPNIKTILDFQNLLSISHLSVSISRCCSSGKWSTRHQERFDVRVARRFTRLLAVSSVGVLGFCVKATYLWGRVSYLLLVVLFCIYFSLLHSLVYPFSH